jgi:hypothetical protein
MGIGGARGFADGRRLVPEMAPLAVAKQALQLQEKQAGRWNLPGRRAFNACLAAGGSGGGSGGGGAGAAMDNIHITVRSSKNGSWRAVGLCAEDK